MPIEEPKTVDEEIDNSLEESFPASDPPSWSRGKRHNSSLPLRSEPEQAELDEQADKSERRVESFHSTDNR